MKRQHTTDEVLLAYAIAAHLVDAHGDSFLPYFQHMEVEVANLQSRVGAADRARAASEQARSMGMLGQNYRGTQRGTLRKIGHQEIPATR